MVQLFALGILHHEKLKMVFSLTKLLEHFLSLAHYFESDDCVKLDELMHLELLVEVGMLFWKLLPVSLRDKVPGEVWAGFVNVLRSDF